VTHLPVWERDHWSTYKTDGLKTLYAAGGRR
jgi:hypothetical protein